VNQIADYLRRLDGNQRLIGVIAVTAACVFTWQYFSAGNARGVVAPPLSQQWPEASGAGDRGNVRADQHARPYRRWRDCTADRKHCGPWHEGPAPGDR
jgi:hypothetical protein